MDDETIWSEDRERCVRIVALPNAPVKAFLYVNGGETMIHRHHRGTSIEAARRWAEIALQASRPGDKPDIICRR